MFRLIFFNIILLTSSLFLYPQTFEELKEKYEEGQKAMKLGELDNAIKIFTDLANICELTNRPIALSGVLNELGGCYMLKGQFDKAEELFNRSIELKKETGQISELLASYNNLAALYLTFGNKDKALSYLLKGEEILPQVSDKKAKGEFLFNLGYFYYSSFDLLDKALLYLNQSLHFLIETKDDDYLAGVNYLIAEISYKIEDYANATVFLENAIESQRKRNSKDDLAKSYNLAGLIAFSQKDFTKANVYFELAAEIIPQGKESKGTAISYFNLGRMYFTQKEYENAIKYFKKTIDITEKLRIKASGDIRKDFFEIMHYAYQYLTATYLRTNQPVNAFNTVESMSAKYLIDQLKEREEKQNISHNFDINAFRGNLPEHTTVLSYSNVSLSANSSDFIGIAIFCISKSLFRAMEIDPKTFSEQIITVNGTTIESYYQQLRGFKPTKVKEGMVPFTGKTGDLEKIINYYRYLLMKVNHTGRERDEFRYLSMAFYKLFISPFEAELNGKKQIIVVPGDILSFIPFETFMDQNGKYLVEKFNIRYVQSLTVFDLISKRKYDKPSHTILAIGNPDYVNKDQSTTKLDSYLKSDGEFLKFRLNALNLIENNPNHVEALYKQLGFSEWESLPGTEEELKQIKNIFTSAELLNGENASEEKIKELSEKGMLKKYNIIHFATHGLAVSELPELSALVLSNKNISQSNDDGYLRASEITKLQLNCNLMVLSACETGLGKIYGGEGVVGLTQSFLIAGAKGLIVSLWQVADQSTMEFMKGFYTLVKENNLTFDHALREIKMKFIKNKYSHPFYWAPFVMYGC